MLYLKHISHQHKHKYLQHISDQRQLLQQMCTQETDQHFSKQHRHVKYINKQCQQKQYQHKHFKPGQNTYHHNGMPYLTYISQQHQHKHLWPAPASPAILQPAPQEAALQCPALPQATQAHQSHQHACPAQTLPALPPLVPAISKSTRSGMLQCGWWKYVLVRVAWLAFSWPIEILVWLYLIPIPCIAVTLVLEAIWNLTSTILFCIHPGVSNYMTWGQQHWGVVLL